MKNAIMAILWCGGHWENQNLHGGRDQSAPRENHGTLMTTPLDTPVDVPGLKSGPITALCV